MIEIWEERAEWRTDTHKNSVKRRNWHNEGLSHHLQKKLEDDSNFQDHSQDHSFQDLRIYFYAPSHQKRK